MLIRFAEVYENTEVLSPIDRETWQIIGETCRIGPDSRVIELASGKGAFAQYLAKRFGCKVDCYDINLEFVDYSLGRTKELGLAARVRVSCRDVNSLNVDSEAYDLGICLGALYIFREAGFRVLKRAVKPQGNLAVSDMYCKKLPPPKEVRDIFFEEEEGGVLTLDETRKWYTDKGLEVIGEEECSRKAWLEYYDLTRKMLSVLARKYKDDKDRKAEIEEALKEDEAVRRYGEEYLGYMTFIMKKR